ncbi:IS21 family transposase [Acetobacterium bakii]|uniref:IS21 family transposase n=1 Tax=Acetobacterium bakii TaxID=52689 RepID=UPI000E0E2154|nr:IS21 family transposase [Acetobacterium bakii]
MSRKIAVKLIMELRANGLSQSSIARSRHMSKTSVNEVFRIAEEQHLSYDDIKDQSLGEVYHLFFPHKHAEETIYALPDYDYVHNELTKVGVTLKILWQEYRDQCTATSRPGVGYTKFCNGYRDEVARKKLTNHLTHKPGVIVEVDWSGKTQKLIDQVTGDEIKVYLFVGTLPYSQYTYVEPCLDMKQNTWLNCHLHMYEYFGGSTVRTVCDNLKTGVVTHPKEGEIILNEAYEALGDHYCTAIMPAPVRKPKAKASVEGSVGKIATAVIAKLRNKVYYTLADLKVDVLAALKVFNDRPFQKRQGSRTEIYETIEHACLRPLPMHPYEAVTWSYNNKIYPDCHIVFEKNHYSCPYQFAGKKADLRVGDTFIEIYCHNERIASHHRFPYYTIDGWSTHDEDLPESFKQAEWNQERFMKEAQGMGDSTLTVIQLIFENTRLPERAFDPSKSVLKLAKKYTAARLENACEMALKTHRSPRYKHLNPILAAGEDILYAKDRDAAHQAETASTTGFIRGASYYGGYDND